MPTILKIAKAIPVHKTDDKSECDNHRLISSISNISKLIVKLRHERLYFLLEKEKIIFEGQYGFRKKSSLTDSPTDIYRKNNRCL